MPSTEYSEQQLLAAIYGLPYEKARLVLDSVDILPKQKAAIWAQELRRQYNDDFAKPLGLVWFRSTAIKPFHRYELKKVQYEVSPGKVSYYHKPDSDEVVITHEMPTETFESTLLGHYDQLVERGFQVRTRLPSIWRPTDYTRVVLLAPVTRNQMDRWFWRYSVTGKNRREVPIDQISALDMVQGKEAIPTPLINKLMAIRDIIDRSAKIPKGTPLTDPAYQQLIQETEQL